MIGRGHNRKAQDNNPVSHAETKSETESETASIKNELGTVLLMRTEHSTPL